MLFTPRVIGDRALILNVSHNFAIKSQCTPPPPSVLIPEYTSYVSYQEIAIHKLGIFHINEVWTAILQLQHPPLPPPPHSHTQNKLTTFWFYKGLQWNLSIVDTLGTAKNVLITHSGVVLKTILSRRDPRQCPDLRGVHISGVSL